MNVYVSDKVEIIVSKDDMVNLTNEQIEKNKNLSTSNETKLNELLGRMSTVENYSTNFDQRITTLETNSQNNTFATDIANLNTSVTNILQKQKENTDNIKLANDKIAENTNNIATNKSAINALDAKTTSSITTINDAILANKNGINDNIVKINTIINDQALNKLQQDNVVNDINNKIATANNNITDLKTGFDLHSTQILAIKNQIASGVGSGSGTPSSGTGLTPAEKAKLDGIEEGANKYIHPSTHPASMIVEGTDKWFMTDAERTKLASVENNANNYIHPATHPASMIEEETNKRFFKDDERTKLAGIENNANNYVHPANHPASMIQEDNDKMFVSKTEKDVWNNIHKSLTVTLLQSSWNNKKCVVRSADIKRDSLIVVSLPIGTSNSVMNMVSQANLICTKQEDGLIEFEANTVPTFDVNINLIISNVTIKTENINSSAS